jgi:hypothetical protein
VDAVGTFKRGRNTFHARSHAGDEACRDSASGAERGSSRHFFGCLFSDFLCGFVIFVSSFRLRGWFESNRDSQNLFFGF